MKPKKTTKRVRREFTAQQKSEAVLGLWTERRKPSALCRELSVSWTTLDSWQRRALEGMLQALAPKRPEKEPLPVLTPRLEKLFAGHPSPKTTPEVVQSRLDQRLQTVQATPPPAET